MILKVIHIITVILLVTVLIFMAVRSNVKLQSTDFLKKYAAAELQYFSEVGFGDSERLTKWNKTIRVQIVPPFQKADSVEIIKIIEELKPLTGKVEIVLVKDDGNLIVRFPGTTKDFNSQRQDDLRQEPRGYTSTKLGLYGYLRKAEIIIAPYLAGKGRWETLRHEFCHGVGLMGHSKRSFNEPHLLGITVVPSLDTYGADMKLPSSLPAADKNAIRLLYDDSLPTGLLRSRFAAAFK